MSSPSPEQIKEARQQAGLTQTQAGAWLHTTVRTWQQWEAGDRKMHPAFWELFQLKSQGKTMSEYQTNPRNMLDNGLTLLQVNPDCAAQLDPQARDFGWLYVRGADGQWTTQRKLPPEEIETAQDQAADMVVKQGTKVRAG